EATRLDPSYALAWAGIADCHGQMVQWEFTQDREASLRLGLEAADRAISLNPGLAEGYKARALILRGKGDHEGVERALRDAIGANPRLVPALSNLATLVYAKADIAGAERLIRRCIEIDPQDHFALLWLSWMSLVTGRPAESLELSMRIRKTTDTNFYVTACHLLRVT